MPLAPVDVARAKLRGKRVALGIVGAIAVPFIASSTVQIAQAVFGEGAGSPDRACSAGVRELQAALDRASARLLLPAEGDGADVTFGPATIPEWRDADAVRRACDASEGGAQAWAALERLRRTEEQLAHDARGELTPLRRDVTAHLPAELR
ncbi:MAG TPA: hypothetical protein VKU41_22490 [Polyangiaceae bacterium]|nr:hypothetical protein [Polyangiaceae bacterium]